MAVIDLNRPARRTRTGRLPLALAHDYATQTGGAERVALLMARAFPGAPLYTSLYAPGTTFPEFGELTVETSRLNGVALLRRHYRAALPLLPAAVGAMRIDADVVLASSTGWAHGMPTTGPKIVYCHAPARWLYQSERYLGSHRGGGGITATAARAAAALALGTLAPALRRWDARAAASAHRYLANSTVTRDAVRQAYGIDAEIVPPPPALLPGGPETPVDGVEPGYLLCVARLLPYKNVDAVIAAVRRLPGTRLVVVGDGPERARLAALSAGEPRVRLLGRVDDARLRWLYRNAGALVAASYEDYGLSPLEAATFGRPAVALRAGGFLDTVVEGVTGELFDEPVAEQIAAAVERASRRAWSAAALREQADRFSFPRFAARLRTVVGEERALV